MARHAYVRVTHVLTHHPEPVEVIAGVALTPEPVRDQYAQLQHVLLVALCNTPFSATDLVIAEAVERELLRVYGPVSYFLEVGRGEMDQYVQVFDPGPQAAGDERLQGAPGALRG